MGVVVLGCVYCDVSHGGRIDASLPFYTIPLLCFIFLSNPHPYSVDTSNKSSTKKNGYENKTPIIETSFKILAPQNKKNNKEYWTIKHTTSFNWRRKNTPKTGGECSSFFGQGYKYLPVK